MSTVVNGPVSSGGRAGELAALLLDIGNSELSASAQSASTQRLLHALGVGLASTRLEAPSVALKALVAEVGEATVIGSSVTRSPGAAAFVNAVAAHSSLQEDCGPGGYREGSHPGVYIVPAALAAAEISRTSGDRLLRGIIVGYEAASRIGAAVPPGLAARRYRPVGVIGAFGAAAAVATVLGADADALAGSLAIAANLAAGTGQGFVSGSMEPYFHAGFAARNGLLAAQLALAGAPTAPDALEGPHGFFAVYAGEPGIFDELVSSQPQLAIERMGSKKFAACLQNQESLELAGELGQQIGAAEVQRVVLSRPNTSENGTASPGVGSAPPYRTMLQRQMSARFSTAAALLGRDVRSPLYFQSSDPVAARLAERVELRESADDEIVVTATLAGGDNMAARGRRQSILYPSGEETAATFLTRASSILGDGPAELALQTVNSLSSLGDASELTRLLRTESAPSSQPPAIGPNTETQP